MSEIFTRISQNGGSVLLSDSGEEDEEFDPDSMASPEEEEVDLGNPEAKHTVTINGKTYTGTITKYTVMKNHVKDKTVVKLEMVL